MNQVSIELKCYVSTMLNILIDIPDLIYFIRFINKSIFEAAL